MVDEAVEATEHIPPTISASSFRELGFLHEVNRLVLHPLGLAMFVDPDKDQMGVFDMRDDPEGVYYHDETLRPEAATYVAEKLEARGQARIDQLGYVIQPLPPEVKQLKVSILEPTSVYLGGPDELDAGEELEMTMHEEQIEGD